MLEFTRRTARMFDLLTKIKRDIKAVMVYNKFKSSFK